MSSPAPPRASRPAVVLAVGGSDSGAGAGIQADLKTVMALGGYCTTAIAALTAQDTTGVHGVQRVQPAFVRLQMECVLRDFGAAAVKTGMLGDAAVIEAVADVLAAHPGLPVVLDPVMVAKGGHELLQAGGVAACKRLLAPLAALLTPNVPEAEILSSRQIGDEGGQRRAAEALLATGAKAVLVKGGHLGGDAVIDVLATPQGTVSFSAPRLHARNTHGTGCTLASAIATGLAQGMVLEDAILRARAYVRAAIGQAPGLGRGHGPMHHGAVVGDWR